MAAALVVLIFISAAIGILSDQKRAGRYFCAACVSSLIIGWINYAGWFPC